MQGSLLETVERGGLPNGAGGCEADHQEGGERWIDELFALSVECGMAYKSKWSNLGG